MHLACHRVGWREPLEGVRSSTNGDYARGSDRTMTSPGSLNSYDQDEVRQPSGPGTESAPFNSGSGDEDNPPLFYHG